MINKNLKFKLVALITLLSFPLLSYGVSQKEMEQARTIAAKAYLRYANDGSGYLDDLNPTTMDELEASLKTKEKENIKAFKAIPVPEDYKDWNKDKLVEYWAVTVFQNKGLLEKGRGGRIRARAQINKMTIAEPQAEPVAPVAEQPQNMNAETGGNGISPEQKELNSEEEALAAEEEVQEEDLKVDKATNYTWVYIMILAILVAIVVALVVYAANVLKKNGSQLSPSNSYSDKENSESTEHLESLIADKDVEISMLKRKLESAVKQNSELQAKLDSLTEEISILKSAGKSEKTAESAISETYPRQTIQRTSLRSIYLGRANMKGIFVRADKTLNPGHSVFVLDTSDGFYGTYRVADSPAAWELALSNPQEYLETACSGYDLNDTAGVGKIVTESAGTAVFEGGCWRVIRKAKIRYE